MSLPEHIAIIMDGNGRWAKKRLLPRVAGHQQGVESVRAIISECLKLHIPYLTLWAFSTENWKRPKSEVEFLFNLFHRLLESEVESLNEQNVRLHIIGDIEKFSPSLKNAIQKAEKTTQNNSALQLNIAFNYGGRWDIVQAAKQMAQKVAQGALLADDIDEKSFSEYMSFAHCPDPDLLIRTSGEYRLSNFLLWQCAYAELYFTETFWPDFREEELKKALEYYQHRNRRFGTIQSLNETDSSLISNSNYA